MKLDGNQQLTNMNKKLSEADLNIKIEVPELVMVQDSRVPLLAWIEIVLESQSTLNHTT